MNFFEHQTRARRNTTRLVFLFVLAVVLIILALYLVGLGIGMYLEAKATEGGELVPVWSWWRPDVLGVVAACALFVIGVGSLWKIHSLSGGGKTVALSLGGKLVNPETTDPGERRLRNVVEEMAISSGVAVPLVYVLEDEEGINAFAAGYTPNDAAVAVTRGALRLWNRDELQGVIAHEFSHILNGDMRLNIRLIGILHGILVIGIIGAILMHSAFYGSRTRSRRGGGAGLIIAVGVALAIIGYVGVFFGRLIKAAASRQREFLADASAVDFTRNPDGIAGALKKIGGFSSGSNVKSPAAEEASHLFFGNALSPRLLFGSALATHPPLADRIRRIDPSFDGKLPRVSASVRAEAAVAAFGGPGAVTGFRPADRVKVDPEHVVGQVGAPTVEHLAHGANLIKSLPETVRAAAREPIGAIALVYALLLDPDQAEQELQFAILREQCEPVFVQETERLLPRVAALHPGLRLPLVDLAIPALRGLSPEQYQRFRRIMELLIQADRKISLFEFALQRVLLHRLAASFERTGRKGIHYWAFTPLLQDGIKILSVLARAGHADAESAERAFRAGMVRLSTLKKGRIPLSKVGACGFEVLGKVLERLALASPVIKERIVDACARCVLADGEVTVKEAELLRAVTDTLDCPLPPFLPSARG